MPKQVTEIALKIKILHDDDVEPVQALRAHMQGFSDWTPGVRTADAQVITTRTKDFDAQEEFAEALIGLFRTRHR